MENKRKFSGFNKSQKQFFFDFISRLWLIAFREEYSCMEVCLVFLNVNSPEIDEQTQMMRVRNGGTLP